jgi:hypothetical protein
VLAAVCERVRARLVTHRMLGVRARVQQQQQQQQRGSRHVGAGRWRAVWGAAPDCAHGASSGSSLRQQMSGRWQQVRASGHSQPAAAAAVLTVRAAGAGGQQCDAVRHVLLEQWLSVSMRRSPCATLLPRSCFGL